jgi:hypothetical protein
VLERCGHIRILAKQTALEEIDLRRAAQYASRKELGAQAQAHPTAPISMSRTPHQSPTSSGDRRC